MEEGGGNIANDQNIVEPMVVVVGIQGDQLNMTVFF